MSLQVWLPLNGNLNNQGLAEISSISGAYAEKQGKIGKGHNTQSTISFFCSVLNNAKIFSIAFWIKADSSSTITSDWNRCFIAFDKTINGTDGSGLRFESTYTSSPRACSMHNNYSYALYNGSQILAKDKDTWYHVCVTCDGINFCSYSNGQQIAKENAVGGLLTGWFAIGSPNYAGCMNDLRIYDHCLSPKEVQDLAKGLAFHYRLAGPGQANLLNGDIQNAKAWVADNVTIEDYSDTSYKGIKVTATSANGRAYNSVNNVWTTSGATYSVSFYGKAETAGTTINLSRSLIDFSPTFTLTTDWKRYTGTIKTTGTATGGTLSIRVHQANAPVYLANIKLENGSIVTPFTYPKNSTVYSDLGYNNIEYDVSGYQQDGQIDGTINWDANTPRYTTSYNFLSGTFIQTLMTPLNKDNNDLTFSFWLKTIDSNATMIDIWTSSIASIYLDNNILTFKDGSAHAFTNYTMSSGKWHYYAITRTNTNINLYVDGSLIQTLASTTLVNDINVPGIIGSNAANANEVYVTGDNNEKVTGSNNYLVTGTNPNGTVQITTAEDFVGNLSDFRIYVTALSEDSIKELYHTATLIDGTNNSVYAYEYCEV